MSQPESDDAQSPEAEADESTAAVQESGPGHGSADGRPEGLFDYGVIGGSTLIVVLSLYLAIRYLVWPGEGDDSHIKRPILEDEPP